MHHVSIVSCVGETRTTRFPSSRGLDPTELREQAATMEPLHARLWQYPRHSPDPRYRGHSHRTAPTLFASRSESELRRTATEIRRHRRAATLVSRSPPSPPSPTLRLAASALASPSPPRDDLAALINAASNTRPMIKVNGVNGRHHCETAHETADAVRRAAQ